MNAKAHIDRVAAHFRDCIEHGDDAVGVDRPVDFDGGGIRG